MPQAGRISELNAGFRLLLLLWVFFALLASLCKTHGGRRDETAVFP
jgi:hypothetical protein